ncbi:hypothetical protein TURU_132210 [Turdus rufiventris]|nr:hypothetical protein TURU_132210 [Turdus rufiventris]
MERGCLRERGVTAPGEWARIEGEWVWIRLMEEIAPYDGALQKCNDDDDDDDDDDGAAVYWLLDKKLPVPTKTARGGDSSYLLKNCLISSVFYLQIPTENCIIRNCNETQKVTRILIDRRLGIFKMGLGCLDKCGGTELDCPLCNSSYQLEPTVIIRLTRNESKMNYQKKIFQFTDNNKNEMRFRGAEDFPGVQLQNNHMKISLLPGTLPYDVNLEIF